MLGQKKHVIFYEYKKGDVVLALLFDLSAGLEEIFPCLLLFILTLMKYLLPSWRTDMLMNMSFKVFLPFALVWLVGTAGILYFMQKGA